ncbi:MAG TPA: toll/interleukin-1 receptor domain-containing protein [Candidatus Acidoferrales bacterium]|nr:toll/interleukin-1 receptor domain-containing protein [Candidatus Acidoferrales bacterium]
MPLSPSDRITLIKEIASRLSTEDWALIDVTLKQFSLPWAPDWNGTTRSYVLQMIEEASDESLIDLARHVGFSFEGRPSHIEPSFWQKGMFRLFVTHLSEHCGYAGQLQEALFVFGISCFVAHTDIIPTQEWQLEIETALATCDALVALLHPNFHQSNWTDQEIGFAMGRGIPVFSVRFCEDDPYGFIGRFQAFNGNGKAVEALAKELFDAYRKNKQTQHRMAEGLIGLFEASGSFALARTRVAYLEELERWEPSFSTRILAALKNNRQIADSWGVDTRVNALVEKWKKKGV